MRAFELLKQLKNTFRPDNFTCLVCREEIFDGSFLCAECEKDFPFNDKFICEKCGRAQEEKGICLQCKEYMPKYNQARSPFCYDAGAKQLLLRYKNGDRALEKFLGDALLRCYEMHYAKIRFDEILFVPLTPETERVRGFNHSKDLAKIVAKKTGIPLQKDIFKTKDTLSQKTLSAKERAKNLKDCFRLQFNPKDKVYLLIDDVMTTGATANEITTLLKKKGAKAVYVLTVACVPYRK